MATEAAWLNENNMQKKKQRRERKREKRLDTHRPSHGRTFSIASELPTNQKELTNYIPTRIPFSEMACPGQLATRALRERLDLIAKPAPCAPSFVDFHFFQWLGLRPEFVRSV